MTLAAAGLAAIWKCGWATGAVVQAEDRLHLGAEGGGELHLPCVPPVLEGAVLVCNELDAECGLHLLYAALHLHRPTARVLRHHLQLVGGGEGLDRSEVVGVGAELSVELLGGEVRLGVGRVKLLAAVVEGGGLLGMEDNGDGHLLGRDGVGGGGGALHGRTGATGHGVMVAAVTVVAVMGVVVRHAELEEKSGEKADGASRVEM